MVLIVNSRRWTAFIAFWSSGGKSRRLSALVRRKTVVIDERDRDRYGRTVAVVAADGVVVNLELVADGLAWVYDRYIADPERPSWKAAEAEARRTKRGLWSRPDAVAPWTWRKTLPEVRVPALP